MKTDSVKQKIKAAVRNGFAILVIGVFLYYLIENRSVFKSVLEISWFHVLGISLGVFLAWLIDSVQTFVLLRSENILIGFWENFMVLMAGVLMNYLPMRVGSLMRFRYFKGVYRLRYARFGSLFGIRMVILVCAAGLVGCVGKIGLSLSGRPFSPELAIIFAGMILASALAYLLPTPKFNNSMNPLLRIWTDFLTGFEALRERPFVTLQIIMLTLLQFAVLSCRFYLTFNTVQFRPSLWLFVLLAPLSVLTTLLAFTPGSLGIREGVIGYVTLASGYDFKSGIFAGAVDRAVLLALTLILGTIGIIYVWAQLREAEKRAPSEFSNLPPKHNSS